MTSAGGLKDRRDRKRSTRSPGQLHGRRELDDDAIDGRPVLNGSRDDEGRQVVQGSRVLGVAVDDDLPILQSVQGNLSHD